MTGAAAGWPAPPAPPILSRDEAHVWHADLDVSDERWHRLADTLSDEEHGRAARFRRPFDSRRFVAAHGMLRALIAGYLRINPRDVAFRRGAHGKPVLTGAQLHFNMSHSGGLALYAISRRGPVGVDVERVRGGIDCDGLAAQFFSRREHVALLSLPEAVRREAFFTCWTRKEAFLKARGDGLSQPLDAFDVSIGPSAQLLDVRGPLRPGGPWWLVDCAAGATYPAAVAGEGPAVRVIRRRWTG